MPREQTISAARRGRILVVDDQQHLCWVLSEILTARGHEVRTAYSAVAAIGVLNAGFACEVAVVDYRLPDSNGIALGGEMKARLPLLRSILMTSYGDAALRQLTIDHGFFAYLDKPFSNDFLIETVEAALGAFDAPGEDGLGADREGRGGASNTVSVPREQMERLANISQFIPVITHELGNPLTIIGSSLQFLHKRFIETNDPAANFTATALENVARMHTLLRGALDFTASREPMRQLADLKDVAVDVLRFTSSECGRRGIEVVSSFDASLPRVFMNVGGVKQILLNLVKNAFDALCHPGGTLRVRTRSVPVEKRVAIDVENSGPPLAPDAMPKLFRPFYTTKAQGTGLGLFLSRQIARDQGGDLVAANSDAGVCFTLTLPLDRRRTRED